MTDNEFLLHDRLAKIKSVIEEYREDNFYNIRARKPMVFRPWDEWCQA